MVSEDEEFSIIDINELTPEEIKETKELGKEKLSFEGDLRKTDDVRLRASMIESSKKEFEAIQSWISNNLRHLKLTVTYLGVFATDDLSRAMIKSLFERLTKLEKLFERSRNPRPMHHLDLPFDPTLTVHIRQIMIPLVGQILPLKKEVEGFSKKFFKF